MEEKKRLYKNNEFKISAPKLNENFQVPGRSCTASNIQDYFEF